MIISQIKTPIKYSEKILSEQVCKKIGIKPSDIIDLRIVRSSIDARKKPDLYRVFSLEVSLKNEEGVLQRVQRNKKLASDILPGFRKKYVFPEKNGKECAFRPIIVGTGPAGLFCGYYLAKAGFRPILLERGADVDCRTQIVEDYWKGEALDLRTNVQFGEGGAGTFSDGKLGTLVKDKDGMNLAVLEAFVSFGADPEILYDYKPHIGTDVLRKVVKNMRQEIITLGGEVHFLTTMTELLFDKKGEVAGVLLENGEKLESKVVVLACGHSARDTIENLFSQGVSMEAKPFAVGLRVEHPQKMINFSQYGAVDVEELGSAPYKLTAQTSEGRNVFSFCMCPGGYVVDASSEEGRIAVNGMSYSGRNGENANSAIIVSVNPSDYGSDHPLAGISFQRDLEEKAYKAGNGRIPKQRFGLFEYLIDQKISQEEYLLEKGADLDAFGFLTCRGENSCKEDMLASARKDSSKEFVLPCGKGQYSWGDVSSILPRSCNMAFVEGMHSFGRKIKGFDREDAILSGVESRTSSPVKIPRDENLEASVKGLYPCGEGAGYAGGITSAAMDGIRVAEHIASIYGK